MLEIRIKPNSRDRYSNSELRLLGQLRHRRLNTEELTTLLYDTQAPLNAATGINAILGTLRQKVEHNNEPFMVQRTNKRGHERVEYWLEPKATNEDHAP